MEALIQKEEFRETQRQVVRTMVECMLLEGKIIGSVEDVAKRIQEEVGVEIKPQLVRQVMTQEMGMRYHKIVKASFHANSN